MSGTLLICFYGPESTGKTEMAKELASHYQTSFVPEVARELLTSNHFNREDIIAIGRTQTERVFEKLKEGHTVLFCDTDVITTQIYSRHYLKVVPPVLYQFESMVHYHHYFLFDVDVPWVADGMRDLERVRQQMFEVFKQELDRRGIAYTRVQGNWDQRKEIIINVLDEKRKA
jgi:HTH-type transcriptional regulator, transcriptional repressor of NAD biosynthesis genes